MRQLPETIINVIVYIIIVILISLNSIQLLTYSYIYTVVFNVTAEFQITHDISVRIF